MTCSGDGAFLRGSKPLLVVVRQLVFKASPSWGAGEMSKSSYTAEIPAVLMVFPSLLNHLILEHALQVFKNGLNILSKQNIDHKYKQANKQKKASLIVSGK